MSEKCGRDYAAYGLCVEDKDHAGLHRDVFGHSWLTPEERTCQHHPWTPSGDIHGDLGADWLVTVETGYMSAFDDDQADPVRTGSEYVFRVCHKHAKDWPVDNHWYVLHSDGSAFRVLKVELLVDTYRR